MKQPRGAALRHVSTDLKAIGGDKTGVSGIEFALILPIMIALFAATVDLGQGLMVSRKVDQIASTVSDLVSRKSSWTSSQLEVMATGAASIVLPFSATTLKIQISLVDVASTGTKLVNWSYGYKTTAAASGAASPVTIPATIAQSGVQMVVSRVTYSLETPFASMLSSITGVSIYNFDSHALSRPRVGDKITKS
ncbi:MAG: TadE/TadG family type IV pilus assembly protein [Allorhizobium sp.]